MKKYLLLLLIASVSCYADTLKMVVPWAPGGATDVAARVSAKELTTIYNTEVIVINKNGAEGMVGINDFVTQNADSNTVLFTGSGSIIYNSVSSTTNYETIRKLVPVVKLTAAGQLLLTKKDSNITTWRQLISASKSRSVSIGTNSSLARDIVNELFPDNPNIIVIPFNSDAQTLNGLLSNTVDAAITTSVYRDRVARGEVNGLAISTERGKFGIPSFTELGVGVVREQWWGVFAPPGTTNEVRNQLAVKFNTIKSSKSYKEAIELSQHAEIVAMQTPNEFAQAIDKEYRKALQNSLRYTK